MGSEAASILQREGGEEMGSSMYRRDGPRGDTVNLQFAVFTLFDCISWDGRGVLDDDVAVDCSHRRVHHQVAVLRKEIKHHTVPGSRCVRGSEAPSFCNHI